MPSIMELIEQDAQERWKKSPPKKGAPPAPSRSSAATPPTPVASSAPPPPAASWPTTPLDKYMGQATSMGNEVRNDQRARILADQFRTTKDPAEKQRLADELRNMGYFPTGDSARGGYVPQYVPGGKPRSVRAKEALIAEQQMQTAKESANATASIARAEIGQGYTSAAGEPILRNVGVRLDPNPSTPEGEDAAYGLESQVIRAASSALPYMAGVGALQMAGAAPWLAGAGYGAYNAAAGTLADRGQKKVLSRDPRSGAITTTWVPKTGREIVGDIVGSTAGASIMNSAFAGLGGVAATRPTAGLLPKALFGVGVGGASAATGELANQASRSLIGGDQFDWESVRNAGIMGGAFGALTMGLPHQWGSQAPRPRVPVSGVPPAGLPRPMLGLPQPEGWNGFGQVGGMGGPPVRPSGPPQGGAPPSGGPPAPLVPTPGPVVPPPVVPPPVAPPGAGPVTAAPPGTPQRQRAAGPRPKRKVATAEQPTLNLPPDETTPNVPNFAEPGADDATLPVVDEPTPPVAKPRAPRGRSKPAETGVPAPGWESSVTANELAAAMSAASGEYREKKSISTETQQRLTKALMAHEEAVKADTEEPVAGAEGAGKPPRAVARAGPGIEFPDIQSDDEAATFRAVIEQIRKGAKPRDKPDLDLAFRPVLEAIQRYEAKKSAAPTPAPAEELPSTATALKRARAAANVELKKAKDAGEDTSAIEARVKAIQQKLKEVQAAPKAATPAKPATSPVTSAPQGNAPVANAPVKDAEEAKAGLAQGHGLGTKEGTTVHAAKGGGLTVTNHEGQTRDISESRAATVIDKIIRLGAHWLPRGREASDQEEHAQPVELASRPSLPKETIHAIAQTLVNYSQLRAREPYAKDDPVSHALWSVLVSESRKLADGSLRMPNTYESNASSAGQGVQDRVFAMLEKSMAAEEKTPEFKKRVAGRIGPVIRVVLPQLYKAGNIFQTNPTEWMRQRKIALPDQEPVKEAPVAKEETQDSEHSPVYRRVKLPEPKTDDDRELFALYEDLAFLGIPKEDIEDSLGDIKFLMTNVTESYFNHLIEIVHGRAGKTGAELERLSKEEMEREAEKGNAIYVAGGDLGPGPPVAWQRANAYMQAKLPAVRVEPNPKLSDYQVELANRMLAAMMSDNETKQHGVGVLTSGAGTGKTRVILAVAKWLMEKHGQRIIVVSPPVAIGGRGWLKGDFGMSSYASDSEALGIDIQRLPRDVVEQGNDLKPGIYLCSTPFALNPPADHLQKLAKQREAQLAVVEKRLEDKEITPDAYHKAILSIMGSSPPKEYKALLDKKRKDGTITYETYKDLLKAMDETAKEQRERWGHSLLEYLFKKVNGGTEPGPTDMGFAKGWTLVIDEAHGLRNGSLAKTKKPWAMAGERAIRSAEHALLSTGTPVEKSADFGYLLRALGMSAEDVSHAMGHRRDKIEIQQAVIGIRNRGPWEKGQSYRKGDYVTAAHGTKIAASGNVVENRLTWTAQVDITNSQNQPAPGDPQVWKRGRQHLQAKRTHGGFQEASGVSRLVRESIENGVGAGVQLMLGYTSTVDGRHHGIEFKYHQVPPDDVAIDNMKKYAQYLRLYAPWRNPSGETSTGMSREQTAMNLRYYMEHTKLEPAAQLAIDELKKGRSVVLTVGLVNQFPRKGTLQMTDSNGVHWAIPMVHGSTARLQELLEGLIAADPELSKELGDHPVVSIHGEPEHAIAPSGGDFLTEEDAQKVRAKPGVSAAEAPGDAADTQDSLTFNEVETNAIKEFQSGKKRVMVVTMEAAGVGINLDDSVGEQGLNPRTMIIVTPPWDSFSLQQMIFRVYRRETKSWDNTKVVMLIGAGFASDEKALRHLGKKLLAAGAAYRQSEDADTVTIPDTFSTILTKDGIVEEEEPSLWDKGTTDEDLVMVNLGPKAKFREEDHAIGLTLHGADKPLMRLQSIGPEEEYVYTGEPTKEVLETVYRLVEGQKISPDQVRWPVADTDFPHSLSGVYGNVLNRLAAQAMLDLISHRVGFKASAELIRKTLFGVEVNRGIQLDLENEAAVVGRKVRADAIMQWFPAVGKAHIRFYAGTQPLVVVHELFHLWMQLLDEQYHGVLSQIASRGLAPSGVPYSAWSEGWKEWFAEQFELFVLTDGYAPGKGQETAFSAVVAAVRQQVEAYREALLQSPDARDPKTGEPSPKKIDELVDRVIFRGRADQDVNPAAKAFFTRLLTDDTLGYSILKGKKDAFGRDTIMLASRSDDAAHYAEDRGLFERIDAETGELTGEFRRYLYEWAGNDMALVDAIQDLFTSKPEVMRSIVRARGYSGRMSVAEVNLQGLALATMYLNNWTPDQLAGILVSTDAEVRRALVQMAALSSLQGTICAAFLAETDPALRDALQDLNAQILMKRMNMASTAGGVLNAYKTAPTEPTGATSPSLRARAAQTAMAMANGELPGSGPRGEPPVVTPIDREEFRQKSPEPKGVVDWMEGLAFAASPQPTSPRDLVTEVALALMRARQDTVSPLDLRAEMKAIWPNTDIPEHVLRECIDAATKRWIAELQAPPSGQDDVAPVVQPTPTTPVTPTPKAAPKDKPVAKGKAKGKAKKKKRSELMPGDEGFGLAQFDPKKHLSTDPEDRAATMTYYVLLAFSHFVKVVKVEGSSRLGIDPGTKDLTKEQIIAITSLVEAQTRKYIHRGQGDTPQKKAEYERRFWSTDEDMNLINALAAVKWALEEQRNTTFDKWLENMARDNVLFTVPARFTDLFVNILNGSAGITMLKGQHMLRDLFRGYGVKVSDWSPKHEAFVARAMISGVARGMRDAMTMMRIGTSFEEVKRMRFFPMPSTLFDPTNLMPKPWADALKKSEKFAWMTKRPRASKLPLLQRPGFIMSMQPDALARNIYRYGYVALEASRAAATYVGKASINPSKEEEEKLRDFLFEHAVSEDYHLDKRIEEGPYAAWEDWVLSVRDGGESFGDQVTLIERNIISTTVSRLLSPLREYDNKGSAFAMRLLRVVLNILGTRFFHVASNITLTGIAWSGTGFLASFFANMVGVAESGGLKGLPRVLNREVGMDMDTPYGLQGMSPMSGGGGEAPPPPPTGGGGGGGGEVPPEDKGEGDGLSKDQRKGMKRALGGIFLKNPFKAKPELMARALADALKGTLLVTAATVIYYMSVDALGGWGKGEDKQYEDAWDWLGSFEFDMGFLSKKTAMDFNRQLFLARPPGTADLGWGKSLNVNAFAMFLPQAILIGKFVKAQRAGGGPLRWATHLFQQYLLAMAGLMVNNRAATMASDLLSSSSSYATAEDPVELEEELSDGTTRSFRVADRGAGAKSKFYARVYGWARPYFPKASFLRDLRKWTDPFARELRSGGGTNAWEQFQARLTNDMPIRSRSLPAKRNAFGGVERRASAYTAGAERVVMNAFQGQTYAAPMAEQGPVGRLWRTMGDLRWVPSEPADWLRAKFSGLSLTNTERTIANEYLGFAVYKSVLSRFEELEREYGKAIRDPKNFPDIKKELAKAASDGRRNGLYPDDVQGERAADIVVREIGLASILNDMDIVARAAENAARRKGIIPSRQGVDVVPEKGDIENARQELMDEGTLRPPDWTIP